MKDLDRWQVAEKLVAARERFAPTSPLLEERLGRAPMKRFIEGLRKAQYELLAELYVTHYTNRQLEALLGFYESDVGQSIVETDRLINREYHEALPSRIERLHSDLRTQSGAEAISGVGLSSSSEDADRDSS